MFRGLLQGFVAFLLRNRGRLVTKWNITDFPIMFVLLEVMEVIKSPYIYIYGIQTVDSAVESMVLFHNQVHIKMQKQII